jgi:hypothetical protein
MGVAVLAAEAKRTRTEVTGGPDILSDSCPGVVCGILEIPFKDIMIPDVLKTHDLRTVHNN